MLPISPMTYAVPGEIHQINQPSHKLSQVKQALEDYEGLPTPTTPEKEKEFKSQKKQILEEANNRLQKLPSSKEQKFLSAKVLMLYGALVYDEHYPHCMGFARASLCRQLQRLGFLAHFDLDALCSDTLDSFRNVSIAHENFGVIDQFLMEEEMIEKVMYRAQALSSEETFLLAQTLARFGFSCCHTEGYKEKSPETIKRFENVYGLAKALYESHHDEEKFRLALAELHYNGYRGLKLLTGASLNEAHEHLKIAKSLNPSLQMQARVANLMACDWYEKDRDKACDYIEQALRIREKMPADQQDPFLLANARNNYCSLLLKKSPPELEKAEKYLQPALEYAEKKRGVRNPKTEEVVDPSDDHQYFGFYNQNMAFIKKEQKKFDEALSHINRALETFLRHQEDSEDMIKKAQALKAQITENLK